MILCIGTTPAVQRVMVFPKLGLDTVNRARLTLDGAAGKAVNVAKVLQTLGEQPVVTGFLGGGRGEQLRHILTGKNIALDFVGVTAETRLCITVIDEFSGTQTELVEESRSVNADDFGKLRTIVCGRATQAKAVVLSGTVTPGGPATFYGDCVREASRVGALSVVDAQGPVLLEALKARPGLVKPNRAELAATVGQRLSDEAALLLALRELAERGATMVVVTAGKEATLAFDGKRFWRVRCPSIQAINPIGSGDAFTAALVWRLLRGDDLGESCRWATAAGAANALSLMPGELEREDVTRLYPEVILESI